MLTCASEAENQVGRPCQSLEEASARGIGLPDVLEFLLLLLLSDSRVSSVLGHRLLSCSKSIGVGIAIPLFTAGALFPHAYLVLLGITCRRRRNKVLILLDPPRSGRVKLRPLPDEQIHAQHGPPRRRQPRRIRTRHVGARRVRQMIRVGPDDEGHGQPSRVIEPRPPPVRHGQPQRGHDKRGQHAQGQQQRPCAALGDGELEGVAVGCPHGRCEALDGHLDNGAEIWRLARGEWRDHGGRRCLLSRRLFSSSSLSLDCMVSQMRLFTLVSR